MPAALKKLPPADADIVAAAEWYDDQQPGLGEKFLEEVDATLRLLAENPEIHCVRFADVRCARLKRFKPYSVFHAGRNPQAIQGRRSRLN